MMAPGTSVRVRTETTWRNTDIGGHRRRGDVGVVVEPARGEESPAQFYVLVKFPNCTSTHRFRSDEIELAE